MRYLRMAVAAMLMAAALVAGCSKGAASSPDGSAGYRQVTAQEAKELMDSEEDPIVLDVRTKEEYAEGHVPGAILIPHDAISTEAEETLTDKGQLILVYCRSGNRSRQAAETLVSLGYTNVVDFGGIGDWPYEIEQ